MPTYGDYLYIKIPGTDIAEEFVHCQMDFTTETLKNQSTTQSGHSDVTIIRKDKLSFGISFRGFPEDVQRCYRLSQADSVVLDFINPAKGYREERECLMSDLSYSRVEKSEKLDYISHNLGLYDISFSLEEI